MHINCLYHSLWLPSFPCNHLQQLIIAATLEIWFSFLQQNRGESIWFSPQKLRSHVTLIFMHLISHLQSCCYYTSRHNIEKKKKSACMMKVTTASSNVAMKFVNMHLRISSWVILMQFNQRVGRPAVVTWWKNTGCSSQRCHGLDSRWLPAFSLSFIFTS